MKNPTPIPELENALFQDLSRLVHTPRAVHVPDVEASRATVLVSGAQRSIECIVRARGGGVGRRPPGVVRARPRLGIEFRFRRARGIVSNIQNTTFAGFSFSNFLGRDQG